jgi:hypothetical protein
MKKWIATFAIVVIAGAALAFWFVSGPSASDFADLRTPRITRVQNQRMLVVQAKGDPNVVAGRAFELLFSAYYKTPGVSRMQKPPAPRARWPHPVATPRTEWIGRYGLPVPADVATAPSISSEAGWQIGVETWEYGEVAEVLHIGPYNAEEANIRSLHTFVAASGRRIIGEHEEEYVRGPGMLFRGDPQKYLTIIRVRVAPGTGDPEGT